MMLALLLRYAVLKYPHLDTTKLWYFISQQALF